MKKIIHVDNSDFFRKCVKTFLESQRFEVESYKEPQEASIAIGSGTADMVIMGLTFADINGKDFLVKTRISYEGPVIIISSSVDKNIEAELIALGATAAINKSGPWKADLKPFLPV